MSTDLEGKKSGCKLCWNGSSFSLEKSEMNYFDNMNIGAITVDSSDNIWIAADNKIFKYLTTKTHKRTSYICYIQRITSHYSQIVYQGTLGNSVKLNAADEILLDYTNNNLTFDFSTTNYFESNTMCYSYKLDGYDEDFSIYETKHQVSYTKLREGEYRFYVKAKNVYGDESNVATIKFTIKAPWYRTTVAYIVYIILIVLIIYLIVQLSIYRLKKTKERLESIVSERTNEISIEKDNVEKQKKLVELKNKDITDSISYAQRIQEAILPDIHEINKQIKNCFFLFQPRDIVSGDFYWYKKISDSEFLIACVDCTGHGVPGAFMSLIGNTLLNEIVNQKKIYSPELLLNELHLSVRTSLKQHSDNSTSRDGMDISIVKCNLLNRSIEYAGANRPLFIVTNKHELIEIKADKYPIGGLQDASKREFKLHHISCEARTRVYMTSDGFADQFGGPNSKKFMVKRFKEMLLESSAMNILDQKTKFTQIITNWRGELEQVDDILVIGFEI
jgi:serine phosphatase RsbU (regulator of sigma subunit)